MPYVIVLVLMLLTGCTDLQLPDLNEIQYGDHYFDMECVWRNHNDAQTLWWCSADVATDLIEGHLALELLENDRLAFCGEDLTLSSGHPTHDYLVGVLTNGMFNCIVTGEAELGNEFDWLWYKERRTLQIIWRPETEAHKQLTLVIQAGSPVTDVEGKVYYKELD
jgi:hypothetical protein